MHGISVYNLCSAYDVDSVCNYTVCGVRMVQDSVCIARLVAVVYIVYALHSMWHIVYSVASLEGSEL